MSHRMTVTLTDEEFAAMRAEAERSAKTVEMLVHEVLAERFSHKAAPSQPLTSREVHKYLHRLGLTDDLPTGEPSAAEDEAERQRLAVLFGQGKSAAEMVIEDRGPN